MNMQAGINRLLIMQAENDARGAEMRLMAPRFRQLAGRYEDGTAPRALTGFNLFQTPRPIAAEMAELIKARIRPGARILEPSAGLGRLYEPFIELDGLRENWLMIEELGECCQALKDAYSRAQIKERNFLTVTAAEIGGQVDAVIMNPPFKQGTDIKHIEHALTLLKQGGRLVALCYNGTRQNAKLKPLADSWEVLPADSFKEAGTGASVARLIVDK